jgi:hypothetical protein
MSITTHILCAGRSRVNAFVETPETYSRAVVEDGGEELATRWLGEFAGALSARML